jgi:hypothetical protein
MPQQSKEKCILLNGHSPLYGTTAFLLSAGSLVIAYLIPVGVVIISLTVAAAAALDGCALEVRIDVTPTTVAQEEVVNDRRLPN